MSDSLIPVRILNETFLCRENPIPEIGVHDIPLDLYNYFYVFYYKKYYLIPLTEEDFKDINQDLELLWISQSKGYKEVLGSIPDDSPILLQMKYLGGNSILFSSDLKKLQIKIKMDYLNK